MANSKTYQVLVSPVVYADLSTHMEFLARVSVSAATKLKVTILKDIRSLSKMPERYPLYERPWIARGRYRYMLSADRYRIVYEIDGDVVRVNGVEDCRRDNKSTEYKD